MTVFIIKKKCSINDPCLAINRDELLCEDLSNSYMEWLWYFSMTRQSDSLNFSISINVFSLDFGLAWTPSSDTLIVIGILRAATPHSAPRTRAQIAEFDQHVRRDHVSPLPNSFHVQFYEAVRSMKLKSDSGYKLAPTHIISTLHFRRLMPAPKTLAIPQLSPTRFQYD